jgi:DNA polymerase-3 subunit alpha
MAKAGVFDFDSRYHRAQYFKEDNSGKSGIELAMMYAQKVQADKISGQTSLFGGGADATMPAEPKLPSVERLALLDELKQEEELVGVFLSKHPLDDQRFVYDSLTTHTIQDYQKALDEKEEIEFNIMGIVTSAKEFISQKGTPYGRFTLMDYSGSVEIALFKDTYLKFKALLNKDYILILNGQTDYMRSKDEMRVTIHSITLGADVDENSIFRSVVVDMTPADLDQGKQQILVDILQQHPGNTPLYFNFHDGDEKMGVKMIARNAMHYNQEVVQVLEEMELKYTARKIEKWIPEKKADERRFYHSEKRN